jgi:hypothetical protein
MGTGWTNGWGRGIETEWSEGMKKGNDKEDGIRLAEDGRRNKKHKRKDQGRLGRNQNAREWEG